MATYVNDLRLKEIGTGESSGTWGTETNTNLELIGEALGFGTEGITTNADTHTTTVADGSDELELSIRRIARWYDAFPKAKVIIGNHDRIIMRKAQTSAIPSKWIKSYKEVLEVPGWDFVERYVKDGVQYLHGEGS